MSRVAKNPVQIPDGVSVTYESNIVRLFVGVKYLFAGLVVFRLGVDLYRYVAWFRIYVWWVLNFSVFFFNKF